MKQQQNDQQVQKILDSLDGMQRAEAPPFLYTRIVARLQQQPLNSWDRLVQWMARPVVAVAIAAGCMLLNAAVYLTSDTPTETSFSNENNLEEDLSSSVTTTLYDY
jgi:hypothetical protein